MSRLPVEVVAEIFKKFLPADVDTTYAVRMNRSKYRCHEAVTTTPLLLGAVCTAWRAIAWSTPALWASITVNIATVPKSLPKIVEEWLERSGTLPLYIMIYNDRSDYIRQTGATHSDELIDVLGTFRHRWFHLYIEDLYLDLFPELFSHVANASMLNILDLDTLDFDGYIDLKMIPNLRRIRYRMSNEDSLFRQFLSIKWTILTHLECATFSSVDIFLELFSKATFLTHFIFCGFSLPLKRFSIQDFPSVLVHERLVYLDFQWGTEMVVSVFKRIRFPALQHVLGEKLNADFFGGFIRHNRCILKTIGMHPQNSVAKLLPFLENNSSLETLILYCSGPGDTILDSLFMRLAKTAGNQPLPSEPVFFHISDCCESMQKSLNLMPSHFCYLNILADKEEPSKIPQIVNKSDTSTA